jgi:ABC-type amino acid transport/signal transduction systems, periplasmic component/domain
MTTIKKILLYGMQFIFLMAILVVFGNKIGKIQGFSVAVVAGTPFETKARQFKNVSEVRLDDDDRQIFSDLANGKVDAIITERLAGLNLIKEAGYRDLRLSGDLLGGEAAAIAFAPADKALRQAVNRALTAMIGDGTYARISHQYFGLDIWSKVKRNLTYPDEPIATDGSWQRIRRKGQLWLVMNYDNPPFAYFDQNNEIRGFNIEIIRAVCERLGIEFVPVASGWERISEGLRVRHYDGIWSAVNDFQSVRHEVEFSDPFYFSGAQLFVHAGSGITGPEVLRREKFRGLFSWPGITPYLPNIFSLKSDLTKLFK